MRRIPLVSLMIQSNDVIQGGFSGVSRDVAALHGVNCHSVDLIFGHANCSQVFRNAQFLVQLSDQIDQHLRLEVLDGSLSTLT